MSSAGCYLCLQLVRTTAPVEVELGNGETFHIPVGRIVLADEGAARRAIESRLVEEAPAYDEDHQIFAPYSSGIFDTARYWRRYAGWPFKFDVSSGSFRGGALAFRPARR